MKNEEILKKARNEMEKILKRASTERLPLLMHLHKELSELTNKMAIIQGDYEVKNYDYSLDIFKVLFTVSASLLVAQSALPSLQNNNMIFINTFAGSLTAMVIIALFRHKSVNRLILHLNQLELAQRDAYKFFFRSYI